MLKTLLGDNFREDMTIDEINEALKGLKLVPNGIPKEQFDKKVSELNQKAKEWESKYKEQEKKYMTDEQIVQQKQQEIEQMKSQLAKELAKLRAKELFTAAGLTEADYCDLLDVVVSDDEEETKNNASKIIALLNHQKESAAKAKEQELLANTPKPPAGSAATVTYSKQIQEALDAEDFTTAAALIRLQQTQQN